MEIVTAKKEDLEIVRKITQSTIKSIYPRYYPAGAVEFFLAHHSDEHIVTDISDNKMIGEKAWLEKLNKVIWM